MCLHQLIQYFISRANFLEFLIIILIIHFDTSEIQYLYIFAKNMNEILTLKQNRISMINNLEQQSIEKMAKAQMHFNSKAFDITPDRRTSIGVRGFFGETAKGGRKMNIPKLLQIYYKLEIY